MNRVNWIADAIDRHRIFVLSLIVLLTVLALVGISRLNCSMNPAADIRGDSEEWDTLKEFFGEFGSEGQACVVILKTDTIFTPNAITALRELVSRIDQSEDTTQIFSIDDVPVISGGLPRRLLPEESSDPSALKEAREAAMVHPLVAGQLLSPNTETAVIIIGLRTLNSTNELLSVVEKIRRIARGVAKDYDVEVLVTGAPALMADWFHEMHSQRIKLIMIASGITLIIAWLLLRNLSAIVITSIPHVFGILWTLGAMGWMGIEMTMLGTAIPALLTAIGFTDSVHLMLHMRREAADGYSARDGAILAIRKIGIACALTSLTTGVGFGSLLLASRPSVRDFGGSCALGCFLTFVAVITFVPLLSGTFLGRRCVVTTKSQQANRWNNFFDRVGHYVLAKPKLITTFSILITVALSATALMLKPDVDIEMYSTQSDSMKAMDIFERDFGGGGMIHVWVDWPDVNDVPVKLANALKDVHTLLDEDSFTSHPISALNLIQTLGVQPDGDNASLAVLSIFPKDLVDRFIRFNHGSAVVNARCPLLGGASSVPAFARIEQSLAEFSRKYPDLRFRLTGVPLLISRSLHMINSDLAKSLGLAAIVIFAIITLEFRSFRYGLICLIPNLFPLVVISAYLFFTGQSLQTVSILVFTICLGIAVDDTIHFMTRFRTELRECGDAYEANKRSFFAVGKALVITTIIFIFCFGSCATSTIPMIKNFAFPACIGFAAALIGDLFILPALLLVSFRNTRREHPSGE